MYNQDFSNSQTVDERSQVSQLDLTSDFWDLDLIERMNQTILELNKEHLRIHHYTSFYIFGMYDFLNSIHFELELIQVYIH